MENNRKLKKKSLKKVLLAFSLATSLLTGCGKKDEAYEDSYKVESTTTEAVSEQVAPVDNLDDKIETMANESFNKYNKYFTSTNEFESKNYTVDDVRNMILLLNGKYDGLTSEEVFAVYNLVDDIVYPFDLQTEINTLDLLEERNADYNESEHVQIERYPKLSDYILDDEDSVKEELAKIEEIRDYVAADIYKNHTYKNVKDLVNKKVVDMFHNENQADMSAESDNIDNAGKMFALTSAKGDILRLTQGINKDNVWISSDNIDVATGQPAQLKINFTEEEKEIVSDYETKINLQLDVTPEEQENYYNVINLMPVYFHDPCDYQKIINEIVEGKKTYTK